MKKITDGVYVTGAGLILSGEKRQRMAGLLEIDEADTPITITREHAQKVLRKMGGKKCFCRRGKIVMGEPSVRDVWLSQEAALIIENCADFHALHNWVVGV